MTIKQFTADEHKIYLAGMDQFLNRHPRGWIDPEMNGFVYIVEHQGFYKVGWALDVEKRVRRFTNIILPYAFTIVFQQQCRHPLKTEQFTHRMFRANRVKGEWFRFNEIELLDAMGTIMFGARMTDQNCGICIAEERHRSEADRLYSD